MSLPPYPQSCRLSAVRRFVARHTDKRTLSLLLLVVGLTILATQTLRATQPATDTDTSNGSSSISHSLVLPPPSRSASLPPLPAVSETLCGFPLSTVSSVPAFGASVPYSIGRVDVTSRSRLRGWLCVPSVPAERLTLHVLVNGQPTGICFRRLDNREDVIRNVHVCTGAQSQAEADASAKASVVAAENKPDSPQAKLIQTGFSIELSYSQRFPPDSAVGLEILIAPVANSHDSVLRMPFPEPAVKVEAASVDIAHMPLSQHRLPLPIRVLDSEPQRINILMTGVGTDLTGGPLSIMRFAIMMSRAGFNLRWINVDGAGIGRRELMLHMKKYAILQTFETEIEYIHDGYHQTDIPTSPTDIFMATLYFTAQMAHATQALLTNKNFIYFIQDYEVTQN